MAEQSSGNSLSGDLGELKDGEMQSLKNEILRLKLVLEKSKELLEKNKNFCSTCDSVLGVLDTAHASRSFHDDHELCTEVDVKSVQTCLYHGSSDLNLVSSCDAETQTFETDFLGIGSCGSVEDWRPPEGSNYTVADLVKQVVEQKPQPSDYVYDENYNMFYSPSTGYYFDTEKNLLYDSHSGTYYKYIKESNTYEFHSQVEQDTELQTISSETMDATVDDLTGSTKETRTSITVKDNKAKREKQKKVSKRNPFNHNSVNGGGELDNANTSSNLAVDEENDESSLEEGELGSPYTESTTTEDSYYLSSVGSPASVNFDDDSTESWPPCIRLIVEESSKLQLGSLLLITCTGAIVGRDKNCQLCIPDVSVSKTHAETSYDNETCQYYVSDLGSQNGTFINGTRLSQCKEKSSPHILKHGDHLCFGFCKLLVHIHPGTETCDECEPGQVQAKHNEESEKCVPLIQTKEEKEKERRRRLRQLKKKFGLQSMNYEQDSSSIKPPSSDYHDRAKERQKTKGSDNPYEKTAEPVSLNVTIPSDNKGYQLLKKMGWKEGEALGAKTSGETEPVPINIRKSRAGLGSALADTSDVPPLHPRNRKWRKAQRRYYETTQESSSFEKVVETTHEV